MAHESAFVPLPRYRRIPRGLAIPIITALLFIIAPTPAHAGPTISTPSQLDFGPIPTGTSSDLTLTVSNTGDADLV